MPPSPDPAVVAVDAAVVAAVFAVAVAAVVAVVAVVAVNRYRSRCVTTPTLRLLPMSS